MLEDRQVKIHPLNKAKMASFWQQLKALLWRNILLKKRNRPQLFQELFFPIYFVAILAVIKITTKPEKQPAMSFPANNMSSFLSYSLIGHVVYVSPNTTQVKNRMVAIVAELKLSISYEMFSSSEAAEAKYKSNTSRVAAGIIFDYEQNPNSYAIRMNYNFIPGTKGVFNYNQGTCRSDKSGRSFGNCDVNTYMHTGFTSLQLAIDKVLMKELKMNTTNPTITVQLMDKPEFSPNTNYIQTLSSVYFVFSFSVLANYLAVNIVAEKEKKIKEGMLMMGLRSSVFWLSWTLIYLAMVVVASGLMIIIIVATTFFSQSNMFLLFLTFLLYGCSFIAFAFMITPFFKKARVAGVVAGFSTVVISCVHLAVSQTRDEGSYDANIPAAGQWLMCLFSPIAFSTIIDQGIFLDVQRTGFGFDSSLTYGKFPLYAPILMLVVDTILYALLTVYFDHVIPGEYGVRYKPYYFLQYSYWCKSRKSDEMTHLTIPRMSFSQTSDVEAVPGEIEDKVAIRISHLTKTFKQDDKTFNAVNGFCLNIYESHITCLLGHNGAGKTTLMNMLTGVVPPTSGTAKILHLDITDSSDLEEIRSHCGICPQHNILYDTLSCVEHLEMFANIKGVRPEKIQKKVESVLQDVDLTSQAETFAKDLSGGQKRKLSVAIALIGDPKLIFLDEPTAGMDPFSRRHLWSLLKKKKEGRAILLTTHFMDEADILADRKAFISKGKLRCCGSSLFLKNKFGIGYHLTMVVTPDCEVNEVTSLLQSKIPDVILQRSHGKEVSYTIPLKDVSKFSELFAHLDQESNNLGIKSYGVSMTTLEEVFLKLESEEVSEIEAENEEIMTFSANSEMASVNVSAPVQAITSLGKSVLTGASLSKQRFKTLLWIRYLLVRRNIQALFFQIFLPIVFVVVGLVLAKVNKTNPVQNPQSLEISPRLYVESSTKSSGLTPLLTFDAVNTTDSLALFDEWRNHDNYKLDIYKAGINTTGQLAPHYLGIQVQNISGKNLNNFVILYNDSALHSVPAAINLFTQTVLSFFNSSASINISSLPWPQTESGILFNSGAFMAPLLVGLAFMLIIPGFAADIVQDREWKLRSQLRISGVSFNEYWASIYAADIILYLIPSVLVLIIVLAMQIDGLSSPGAVGSLVLLFAINMPFYIVLALVLSFIFDKTESCISYLPQILTIVAMIPFITVSLVDMIARSKAAIIIHYVACVVDPPYIMFGGFYFISRVNVIAVQSGLQVTASDYFKWDNHFIITIILPVIHFVWMYWLLRVLDIKKTGGKVKEAFPCLAKSVDSSNNINPDIIEVEDDDVKLERTHVENLHSFDNPTFCNTSGTSIADTKPPVAYTQRLRKVYHKRTKKANCFESAAVQSKVAVRNLSLGVNEGEVMGLLGPNGAGKTTVLGMIIAETEPTCGKVIVSGYNNRSHMLSVLEFLGYCPQHDALWESITLEEHIRCFAAIKGIDPKHLDAVIDYYVSSLKLEEHKKKRAKKLSGGTKRKLSYIMSILGSPRLVLLDEPSTGMDPQSKRFLWDTISASFKKTERGAILTTHYMEEADALCDRVGIMVNGQLECLGSTQHLKSKYGSGYILEVKLRYNASTQVESLMDSLEEHLNKLFPGLEKVERFQERAQYAIPKDDVKFLGVTFSNLEKCKETHNLEEYNFSQSTLEQVFLYFAKKQQDEDEENEIKQQTLTNNFPTNI
uniref:ABC transporter domain-containing protein n=2 Tax=Biomphalaria glabrata TaxID=6526 RepID=A0A2C9L5H4_BIOGL